MNTHNMPRKNNAMSSPTLLVVIAHPDDESFPMGGTLAKYAAEGIRVVLVSATRGEAGIPALGPAETARRRETELKAAARTLGVSRLVFLDYEDGQFDQADAEQVIAQLLEIIRQENPAVVITFGPDGISGHPDHIATYRFVTRAFERANLPGRLFYLMPSEATQQGCGIAPSQTAAGGPVASIDITDFRLVKVLAMQCHASQNPPYPGDPVTESEKLACHEYFVLASPLVADAEMSDLFDRGGSESRLAAADDAEFDAAPARAQITALAQQYGSPVLDVGTGACACMAVAMAEQGLNVTAVDHASSAVRIAQERAAGKLSAYLDVRHAEGTKLPFSTGSYRVVTAFDALCHAAEPAGVVTEMFRVCADNGAVIITELNADGRRLTQHHNGHIESQLPELLAEHCDDCYRFDHAYHVTYVCKR